MSIRTALAAILLLSICSCAHQRVPLESPLWRACVRACAEDGAEPSSVYEDATEIECVCRKPPAKDPI